MDSDDIRLPTGNELSIDLRKNGICQTEMEALEHKFDEVRRNGLLLQSALDREQGTGTNGTCSMNASSLRGNNF